MEHPKTAINDPAYNYTFFFIAFASITSSFRHSSCILACCHNGHTALFASIFITTVITTILLGQFIIDK